MNAKRTAGILSVLVLAAPAWDCAGASRSATDAGNHRLEAGLLLEAGQQGSDCPEVTKKFVEYLDSNFNLKLIISARESPPKSSWQSPERVAKEGDIATATEALTRDLNSCADTSPAVARALDQLGDMSLSDAEALQSFLNSSAIHTQFDRQRHTAVLEVAPNGTADVPHQPSDEASRQPLKSSAAVTTTIPAAPSWWVIGPVLAGVLALLLAALSLPSLLLWSMARTMRDIDGRFADREGRLAKLLWRTNEILQDQNGNLTVIERRLRERFERRQAAIREQPAAEPEVAAEVRSPQSDPNPQSPRLQPKMAPIAERTREPFPLEKRFRMAEILSQYQSAVASNSLDTLMGQLGSCAWVRTVGDGSVLEVVGQPPRDRSVLDLFYCAVVDGQEGVLLPGPNFFGKREAYGSRDALGRALSPVYRWVAGSDFVIKEPALGTLSEDLTSVILKRPGTISLSQ